MTAFRAIAAIALTIASPTATCQFGPVDKKTNPFDPNWFWTISKGWEMDSSNEALFAVGCSPGQWQAIRVAVVNARFDNDKDDGRVRVQFKIGNRDPEDITGFYFDRGTPAIIERSSDRSEFLRLTERISKSSSLYVRAFDKFGDSVIAKYSTEGLTEALATLKTQCDL